MGKSKLAPTQEAVEYAETLFARYIADLEAQENCVANEDRGGRASELVPADYEEADRRIRNRVGRKKTPTWAILGSVASAIAAAAFSQLVTGIASQSKWWSVWYHTSAVVVLASLALLGAVIFAVQAQH